MDVFIIHLFLHYYSKWWKLAKWFDLMQCNKQLHFEVIRLFSEQIQNHHCKKRERLINYQSGCHFHQFFQIWPNIIQHTYHESESLPSSCNLSHVLWYCVCFSVPSEDVRKHWGLSWHWFKTYLVMIHSLQSYRRTWRNVVQNSDRYCLSFVKNSLEIKFNRFVFMTFNRQ